MVIDTSAIFAAIAGEPDSPAYREAIKAAPVRLLSAVTMLEARIVLFARLGPAAIAIFDELIAQAEIAVVPFDAALADAAFDAFRRYGKGQGSPANAVRLARPRSCGAQGLEGRLQHRPPPHRARH